MKHLYLIAVSAAILSGCATNITPQATGGSRSDGTVTMSYQFGGFQKPIVDWNTARANASRRCESWGYADAEPFGGASSVCVMSNMYGCTRHQINMTYQCIGQPERDK